MSPPAILILGTLPHKCGVPVSFGSLNLCGSELSVDASTIIQWLLPSPDRWPYGRRQVRDRLESRGKTLGRKLSPRISMQVYRGLDIGTAKPTGQRARRACAILNRCGEINETFIARRLPLRALHARQLWTESQRRGLVPSCRGRATNSSARGAAASNVSFISTTSIK